MKGFTPMTFRILYQDPTLIAIEKPAGFHVHPPEDKAYKISRAFNCLHLLRNQVNTYLYPVHRLDRATSGVLLFALNSPTAKTLCTFFEEKKVQKTYICVTRGWSEDAGVITHPLKSETNRDQLLESSTSFVRVGKIELPYATGRYPTSRYSLLRVSPHTGRKHQIRRHFNHLSHPLIGDSIYGDSDHNRLFKNQLQIEGLLLKAHSIEFPHPETGERIRIRSRWNGRWHKVFDLFNLCPMDL